MWAGLTTNLRVSTISDNVRYSVGGCGVRLACATRESDPLGYMMLSPQVPDSSMEKALWYLIAGTRGGENRAKIIRILDNRPRNANQLADELDIKYNTVRHHLDMLLEHNVIDVGDQDYGKLYFLSEEFETHRDMFESITENLR